MIQKAHSGVETLICSLLEVVLFALAFGIGFGITLVEYATYRTRISIKKLINEAVDHIRNDGELREKVASAIEDIVDRAIDRVKNRMWRPSGDPPPSLETYLHRRKVEHS